MSCVYELCEYRRSGGLSRRRPWPVANASPVAVAQDAVPSSLTEPVLSRPILISQAVAGGPPTQDGTCGKLKGDTTCVGWSTGECCSMYGWCGKTVDHCGKGCQSGPCTEEGGTPEAPGPAPAPITNGGRFDVIGQSGVPAMHAALMQNGRVMFLDKVEDYTQLKLPNGRFAYSSEYNPETNKAVGLSYKTNAFCAGGTFLANGDMLAIGGNGPLTWLDDSVSDGFDGLRFLTRSSTNAALNGQSWREPGQKLNSKRWYPSVQTLANGKVFVVSGSINGDPSVPANNNPTYEILSATGYPQGGSIPMEILEENQPYYMYPFMHLLKDGNIFIFTARASQIFNINTNSIVKKLPNLAGDYRTYPNTGGSVLMPLSSSNNWASTVMICGGGAYQDITSPTEPSCGTISPESANPTWSIESMPEGRGMVEAVLLPDGTVLWLNGANRGAQGFLLATDPTLRPLLYDPKKAKGSRWSQLAASKIPRLYHSVALLLLDGTILVAGSGPNEMPVLTAKPGNPYPTEFRVERFTPPYLQGSKASLRPTALQVPATVNANGGSFTVSFNVPTSAKSVKIALYHGGFVTHSLHMGHRMLFLDFTGWKAGQAKQTLTVKAPPNLNVAPPGPYVIYAVADGIPSVGKFVKVA
ncbi:glyoxal oxidase [Tricharina praecox]|uniref:glyoxal oxidase n=1 Tax=Tricharina praecox TaxID=43433 RepID=UPI00221F74B7|nr:glyoxal oxidase [Tricharina praecox]KAI5845943.1 glyoxal oxidase [Tricharina praecox]